MEFGRLARSAGVSPSVVLHGLPTCGFRLRRRTATKGLDTGTGALGTASPYLLTQEKKRKKIKNLIVHKVACCFASLCFSPVFDCHVGEKWAAGGETPPLHSLLVYTRRTPRGRGRPHSFTATWP